MFKVKSSFLNFLQKEQVVQAKQSIVRPLLITKFSVISMKHIIVTLIFSEKTTWLKPSSLQ